MGNKSDRKGKYYTYYVTISCVIAVIQLAACTPLKYKLDEINAHRQLNHYRNKLADGFFETIIQHSLQVVKKNETLPPADIAFYSLGEVYAHHDYRGQDFVLSKYYFKKLLENFPESPLTSEARVYLHFMDEIAAKEQETAALKKQSIKKEQLTKERLNLSQTEEKTTAVRGRVIENNNFDEALKKNMLFLENAGTKKPADQALYNLGLIYAHDGNPKQDYKKSQHYFFLLTKQFPDSDYFEEAQIWFSLFKTIEKIQQIDIDIEQQKKQLSQ